MLKTIYKPGHPYPGSPTRVHDRCMSRERVFVAELPTKVALSIIAGALCVILIFLSLTVFPPFVALPGVFTTILGMFIALRAIWYYVQATVCRPEVRALDDEVLDIVKTYGRLLKVRSLLPEGTGSREKIDEYGRLAFLVLQEADRLPRGMGGENKNFYRVQNEIQTEMRKLINSGEELVDLVSTRRAENTLHSVQHLGIAEYAEHVSLETMAYRSLTAGDAQESPKEAKRSIPPRPRGDSVRSGRTKAKFVDLMAEAERLRRATERLEDELR